jgi:SSS family solute:Na+ symporter
MVQRLASRICASFIVLFVFGCQQAAARGSVEEAHLDRARAELRKALRQEQKFVKVHAAEALLEFGIGEDVRGVFEDEQKLHSDEQPYHIGIWRVLARTSTSDAERQQYIEKILAAWRTNKEPDTANAVETLAKLEFHTSDADRAELQKWTEATKTDRRSFGRWLLAVPGNADDVRKLAELLKDDDPDSRGAAAYGLRFLGKRVPDDVIPLFEAAAESVRAEDRAAYLIGNAWVFTKDPAKAKAYHDRLVPIARTGIKTEKFEALNCFAARGDVGDVPLLVDLLTNDPEADVRLNAARALLAINSRTKSKD